MVVETWLHSWLFSQSSMHTSDLFLTVWFLSLECSLHSRINQSRILLYAYHCIHVAEGSSVNSSEICPHCDALYLAVYMTLMDGLVINEAALIRNVSFRYKHITASKPGSVWSAERKSSACFLARRQMWNWGVYTDVIRDTSCFCSEAEE